MAAMMTETATIDEKIAEMGYAIAKLTKTVEEKDLQIATLMNKLEVKNQGESSEGILTRISIHHKMLTHLLQRRLVVHKGALPQFHLYRSSSYKIC